MRGRDVHGPKAGSRSRPPEVGSRSQAAQPGRGARVSQTYPGQWRNYGENVLQNWCGASGEKLVEQWMRSPGHRLNLLNPAHTHLGVGAAVADSSKLYSTQNFVRLR